MKRKLIVFIAFSSFTLSACPKPPPPPPAPQLKIYKVEMREKINTCRPVDPQVANEMIVVEDWGDKALMHLGAEHVFPLHRADKTGAGKDVQGKWQGDFVESDHTKVDGHHLVCKRLTNIELKITADKISGSYERKRRQDCVIEAKPCSTVWSISGALADNKH